LTLELTQPKWLVLRCRGHLTEGLVERVVVEFDDVTVWVPRVVHRARVARVRRKLESEELALPGWVFVKPGSEEAQADLLERSRVGRPKYWVVRRKQELMSIPEHQMLRMFEWAARSEVEEKPGFQVGDEVSVAVGPLEGIVGRIVAVEGAYCRVDDRSSSMSLKVSPFFLKTNRA
jgi:transcription antitermination factor NusG